jgi:hypothetical protein
MPAPKTPAPAPAQTPPPAPSEQFAPQKHSHIAVWLFAVLFLVALVALVYVTMVAFNQKEKINEFRDAKEAAIEMIEEKKAELDGQEAMEEAEVEEESEEEKIYSYTATNQLTFDYLEGWHVASQHSLSGNGLTESISTNTSPVVFCAACGGPITPVNITIYPVNDFENGLYTSGVEYVESQSSYYANEHSYDADITMSDEGSGKLLEVSTTMDFYSEITPLTKFIFGNDKFIVVAKIEGLVQEDDIQEALVILNSLDFSGVE